jgi:hypothetical protein
MPQFMMLIYNPPEGGPSPEEMPAQHARWTQFTQNLKDAGLFVAGDPLQGVDVATTVRVRGGETQFTDGPFAETKEHLAGYYLVEAGDLDTVLDFASRIPSVDYGSVEVRPIADLSQTPYAEAAEQVRAS